MLDAAPQEKLDQGVASSSQIVGGKLWRELMSSAEIVGGATVWNAKALFFSECVVRSGNVAEFTSQSCLNSVAVQHFSLQVDEKQ
ncbi:hypothetical protein Trydic_g18995 [Trypoxylus dichotomus]